MLVKFSQNFYRQYKKANVRIRKNARYRLLLFFKNIYHPELHNHCLKRNYIGFHSINITNDWRAIYYQDEKNRIHITSLGTHKQLYQ